MTTVNSPVWWDGALSTAYDAPLMSPLPASYLAPARHDKGRATCAAVTAPIYS